MEEFLNYSIFTIGSFNLTVESIVNILLIIFITWFLLFIISRVLLRFFKTNQTDPGRKHAIMQLIRYLFWTIAFVLMLDSLGIKITILLAGSAALLVGLGFGLQQIFQDLVSGIFILIEGTIRVDDVIELDGLVGKILSIKLRTSQVLTRDGIIIIVPNHKFIVDNIINWSQNAIATRFKVSVGVAYGSDVELVRKILIECARSHTDAITSDDMKSYHPFARFIDFGDSSLNFELYFWSINIFHIENAKSDIRFMINQKFKEHGVTIPFPQRDVHIKNQ
jgi:small-conductance mechanosensitive channel